MRLRTCSLALAFILIPGTAAFSQVDVSIPVEIESFPHEASEQRMPQWCWAASLASVFAFYGVERTQEQIVAATYGRLENLPAFDPRQLFDKINSMSFRHDGGLDVTVGGFGVGAPQPAFLLSEIRSGHPVIAWYSNGPGMGGHAVVIFGVRYSQTPTGPLVSFIKYFDPWPGNGTRVVQAAQLAQAMSCYFVVRSSTTTGKVPSAGGSMPGDSCEYSNDETCDEPGLCSPGTDTTDCRGVRSRADRNPLPVRRPCRRWTTREPTIVMVRENQPVQGPCSHCRETPYGPRCRDPFDWYPNWVDVPRETFVNVPHEEGDCD
ncbi:MAG: hypothetical protein HY901_31450 [Deltaproteobacteria bacterium]|nr:hypothetical protein [Deltaproteobacteria bacterium]